MSLKKISSRRMNLGVVTLNLPRIALESSESIELFWEKVDKFLAISKDGLLFKATHVIEANQKMHQFSINMELLVCD